MLFMLAVGALLGAAAVVLCQQYALDAFRPSEERRHDR